MSLREEPPTTPRCPECKTASSVEPYPDPKRPWLCAGCNRVFVGTLGEYERHQAAKAEAWAERQAPIPDQLRDLRERED